MTRKGIFSIASGGSKDSPAPEASAENVSPFSESSQGGNSDSPFAREPGADEPAGGDEPFKMDGFGHDDAGSDQPGDSPFKTFEEPQDDYEAAKANLEPQHDFAAGTTPFKPALASMGEDADDNPSQHEQASASSDEGATTSQVTIEPVADVPVATPAPFQVPSTPAPMQSTSSSSGMQQLEIRAIFGVDHVLNANEIIQRARSLSGIGTVATVAGKEQQALSDFRAAIKTLGLGEPDLMEINFGSGSVDFIVEGNTTLAVLQQGPYAPGVKETLIIVARELDKLA